MAKVICRLPNAAAVISGVKFSHHPDNSAWKVSEEISDEQAALFASVNGYELVGAKQQPTPGEDAELAELRARATALNIPYASTLGLKKLREQVPLAEEAAARGSSAAPPPPAATPAPSAAPAATGGEPAKGSGQ